MSAHSLCLKSEPPSAATGPNAKPAYAVLCTPNKTYQVRQVQTSNSLFVTQTALEAHGNEIPVPTTRAIASCTATVELLPAQGSPIASLEKALPLYDIVDGEVEAATNRLSKTAMLSDLPFSDGECEEAWTTLMAFEFGGSVYRPTANTLSQVWRSINATAVAEGVKLDQQFLTDDIARAVAEEGHPASLVVAIVKHLAEEGQDPNERWSSLDQAKTVQFVGKTLLEAKRDGPNYLTAEFLEMWKDSLPESWRDQAELKTIDGAFDLPSSTTVRLKGSIMAGAKPEAVAPKPSASRKWHEKFGRARKR